MRRRKYKRKRKEKYGKRMCLRSSSGQSNWLLTRRLQDRGLSGVPIRRGN